MKNFLFYSARAFLFLVIVTLVFLGIYGIFIGNIYVVTHINTWIPIVWISCSALALFFIVELSLFLGICVILQEQDDGFDEEI